MVIDDDPRQHVSASSFRDGLSQLQCALETCLQLHFPLHGANVLAAFLFRAIHVAATCCCLLHIVEDVKKQPEVVQGVYQRSCVKKHACMLHI